MLPGLHCPVEPVQLFRVALPIEKHGPASDFPAFGPCDAVIRPPSVSLEAPDKARLRDPGLGRLHRSKSSAGRAASPLTTASSMSTRQRSWPPMRHGWGSAPTSTSRRNSGAERSSILAAVASLTARHAFFIAGLFHSQAGVGSAGRHYSQ